MRRFFLVLAIVFVPAAARSGAPTILGPDGLGPLRIGMTERGAERVIGLKLELSADASGDAEACQEGGISGRPGIYVLTEHHRIARIVVSRDAAEISTSEGVHVGTSESQLRGIFGKRATFSMRPYEGDVRGAHEVTVKLNGDRAFVFETEDFKVEEMRVGALRAVQYWEGCA